MNPFERELFSDLAWFEPKLEGHESMRSLTLWSWKAMELMKLKLRDPEAEMTSEEYSREMMLYIWLHTAPKADINDALWNGSWHAVAKHAGETLPHLAGMFQAWFNKVMNAVQASLVAIRPRPREEGAEATKTPLDVLGPVEIVFKLRAISQGINRSDYYILHELWLPQALQIYHAVMRWEGSWTVPPGRETPPEQLQDISPDFGNEPSPEDSDA